MFVAHTINWIANWIPHKELGKNWKITGDYASKFSAEYLTESSPWKCRVPTELAGVILPIHVAP